jgi:hypothetical protein
LRLPRGLRHGIEHGLRLRPIIVGQWLSCVCAAPGGDQPSVRDSP